MTTLHQRNVGGELDAAMTDSGTSMSSPALSALDVVASPDIMHICVDPDGIFGEPEWMQITAHSSGSTTATVTRGTEGSTARAHTSGVEWVHTPAPSEADEWQLIGPSLWLPATVFDTSTGAPTLDGSPGSERSVGWLFDASSDERVATNILIPHLWSTLTIKLYWVNNGAGSGDVVWDVFLSDVAESVTIAVTDFSDTGTVATAGAEDVLVITDTLVDQAISGGLFAHLRVQRDADNASDTLANDAALLGVLVEGTV